MEKGLVHDSRTICKVGMTASEIHFQEQSCLSSIMLASDPSSSSLQACNVASDVSSKTDLFKYWRSCTEKSRVLFT